MEEADRGRRKTRTAALSRDTDLGKTEDTRRVIEGMVDGLNDHRIDDIGAFFADRFPWLGHTGCGTKTGGVETAGSAFQAAFSDKVCIDEARLFMGGGRRRSAARRLCIPAVSWDRGGRQAGGNPLHGFLEG